METRGRKGLQIHTAKQSVKVGDVFGFSRRSLRKQTIRLESEKELPRHPGCIQSLSDTAELISITILRGDCKPYPHNVKLVNF